MKPPEGKEVFETQISTYWMGDDGILYSTSKPSKRTIENTSENFATVKKITSNKKIPLLTYLGMSAKPDKATRDFVAKELPKVYTAMAIVSASPLGKIVMNIIFSMNAPTIPMKTFSNDADAKEWLKQFIIH
ncbi:MAG: STAS/SEC14 domain-containing protein [Bacteroidia bacterium]